MARTKFQQFQAAKKSHCEGRTTTASLNKKKKAYETDARKKGKTKAEVSKTVKRVMGKPCGISGTKKRKTAKKKAATRRRR